MSTDYQTDSGLVVTRFHGGPIGACYQITTPMASLARGEYRYVQLTREEARDLVETLTKLLADE